MNRIVEFELEYKHIGKEFLPVAGTRFSAGLDLKTTKDISLAPMQSAHYGTGVRIKSCQCDHLIILELRSSLRFKRLCTGLGIGIIDPDYRGEIKGVIMNLSNERVHIARGERIAQLVIGKFDNQIQSFSKTVKNERTGGMGSTGK